MNFIVYLLVLIAWAPSFGYSQGSPAAGSASPTGGSGVDANAEIEAPETGLFVGILESGFGGSGKGGLFSHFNV